MSFKRIWLQSPSADVHPLLPHLSSLSICHLLGNEKTIVELARRKRTSTISKRRNEPRNGMVSKSGHADLGLGHDIRLSDRIKSRSIIKGVG